MNVRQDEDVRQHGVGCEKPFPIQEALDWDEQSPQLMSVNLGCRS